MPELPEVETTRRGLLRALKGQRIAEVELKRSDLRFPLPGDLVSRLEGCTVNDIRRRAKYLLFDLDSGDVVLAHLGMSGSFRMVAADSYEARKHDHVLWYLENGRVCVFHDPRRFGLMDVMRKAQEKTHPLLAHLGPEPLGKQFSPSYLAAQLARRKGPIKPALMDQKLVVGVGNIYASESLFLCGIRPDTPAYKVAPEAAMLIDCIRTTLKAAIASGGSSLRDYVGADGADGYFQHRFNVYERDGKKCFRCKSIVQSGIHAGRSTYWCPRCQPKRAKAQKT